MEAIREIVEVKEGKITLQLPKSFTAKRVELIVLPSADGETPPTKKQKISSLRGKLAKRNEIELDRQLQQLRDEWENDI